MKQIKDAIWFVWDLAVDGYDIVTGWMGRHPQAVFWLVLVYLVVRR